MTISVDGIEAIWIASNGVALVVTIYALIEAWADRAIAPAGTPQRLVARGNVRREALRVICQMLLLSVVVPGIFTDRPTPITFIVAALVMVPIVLLISSVADTIDRRALLRMVYVNRGEAQARKYLEPRDLLADTHDKVEDIHQVVVPEPVQPSTE